MTATMDHVPPFEILLSHMNAPYLQEIGNPTTDNDHAESARLRTYTEQSIDDMSSDGEETCSVASAIPWTSSAYTSAGQKGSCGASCFPSILLLFGPCVEADVESLQEPRNAMCTVPSNLYASVETGCNGVHHFISILRDLESGWDHLLETLNLNDPSRA